MIMNKRGGGEFPFAALIENIHPSVAERGRRLKKTKHAYPSKFCQLLMYQKQMAVDMTKL